MESFIFVETFSHLRVNVMMLSFVLSTVLTSTCLSEVSPISFDVSKLVRVRIKIQKRCTELCPDAEHSRDLNNDCFSPSHLGNVCEDSQTPQMRFLVDLKRFRNLIFVASFRAESCLCKPLRALPMFVAKLI